MTEYEAIEVLKKLNFCGICTTGPCGECERKLAKEAALIAMEEIQQYRNIATCEWIPCSERLPEEDGFYQVTVQIKETGECYVEKKYYKIKKGWESYLAKEFIDVIAWMPLPEPYKLQEITE